VARRGGRGLQKRTHPAAIRGQRGSVIGRPQGGAPGARAPAEGRGGHRHVVQRDGEHTGGDRLGAHVLYRPAASGRAEGRAALIGRVGQRGAPVPCETMNVTFPTDGMAAMGGESAGQITCASAASTLASPRAASTTPASGWGQEMIGQGPATQKTSPTQSMQVLGASAGHEPASSSRASASVDASAMSASLVLAPSAPRDRSRRRRRVRRDRDGRRRVSGGCRCRCRPHCHLREAPAGVDGAGANR
jgi:hypothetical protein